MNAFSSGRATAIPLPLRPHLVCSSSSFDLDSYGISNNRANGEGIGKNIEELLNILVQNWVSWQDADDLEFIGERFAESLRLLRRLRLVRLPFWCVLPPRR
jgi:hypothetical protein